MSIVSIASYRKPPQPQSPVIENRPPETAMKFVTEELYSWALDQGIDIESTDFKFESATILTVLQGMLFRIK